MKKMVLIGLLILLATLACGTWPNVFATATPTATNTATVAPTTIPVTPAPTQMEWQSWVTDWVIAAASQAPIREGCVFEEPVIGRLPSTFPQKDFEQTVLVVWLDLEGNVCGGLLAVFFGTNDEAYDMWMETVVTMPGDPVINNKWQTQSIATAVDAACDADELTACVAEYVVVFDRSFVVIETWGSSTDEAIELNIAFMEAFFEALFDAAEPTGGAGRSW